jgi:hypothetical protein
MDWRLSWRLVRYHRGRGRHIVGNGNAKVAALALVFGGGGTHDVREVPLFLSIIVHYLDEGMRRVHLAV